MSELTFSRPELWPFLLLVLPAWLLVWWLVRARRHARQAYGAILTEVLPSATGRATRLGLVAMLLLLTWMEPRLGEEQRPALLR